MVRGYVDERTTGEILLLIRTGGKKPERTSGQSLLQVLLLECAEWQLQ